MQAWRSVAALAVLVALAASAAETGAQAFARSTELLRKGDLSGALEAVGAAARADPQNPACRQQYMLLQRVLKTRDALATESDPAKWWQMALGLRNFYYANGLYAQVVALARQMHEKQPSAASATILADAHLALGQNAEAGQVLGALDAKALTLQAKALLGIALARQKKVDQAKAILGELALPDDPGPRFLFDVARLRVLCGDADGGLATLKTALESTSPRALDAFRDMAKSSGDFASVAGGEGFAKVLATESKVEESACSSGAGCGNCPSRKACPSTGDAK